MVDAPEPPHHHHHKTGLPWFDLIMPLAVLAISLASLLTALQSEHSMGALVEQNRRLVSAQSTPLLMLDSGNEDGGKRVLSLTISNVGTGPAQIAWFRAADSQGNDLSSSGLRDRLDKIDPNAEVLSQQVATTLIRSGDQRLVFKWPRPTGNSTAIVEWDRLDEARRHLHASACYCSIFDECRVTEFSTSRPKPVASCDQAHPPS